MNIDSRRKRLTFERLEQRLALSVTTEPELSWLAVSPTLGHPPSMEEPIVVLADSEVAPDLVLTTQVRPIEPEPPQSVPQPIRWHELDEFARDRENAPMTVMAHGGMIASRIGVVMINKQQELTALRMLDHAVSLYQDSKSIADPRARLSALEWGVRFVAGAQIDVSEASPGLSEHSIQEAKMFSEALYHVTKYVEAYDAGERVLYKDFVPKTPFEFVEPKEWAELDQKILEAHSRLEKLHIPSVDEMARDREAALAEIVALPVASSMPSSVLQSLTVSEPVPVAAVVSPPSAPAVDVALALYASAGGATSGQAKAAHDKVSTLATYYA